MGKKKNIQKFPIRTFLKICSSIFLWQKCKVDFWFEMRHFLPHIQALWFTAETENDAFLLLRKTLLILLPIDHQTILWILAKIRFVFLWLSFPLVFSYRNPSSLLGTDPLINSSVLSASSKESGNKKILHYYIFPKCCQLPFSTVWLLLCRQSNKQTRRTKLKLSYFQFDPTSRGFEGDPTARGRRHAFYRHTRGLTVKRAQA